MLHNTFEKLDNKKKEKNEWMKNMKNNPSFFASYV